MAGLRRPFPEAEGAVKAWLRLTGLVDRRAYLGAPISPTFPLFIVYRVGGAPVLGGVPIDRPLMQIDVEGDPAKRGKDRYDLAELANALKTEIESITSILVTPTVKIDQGEVQSGPLWRPAPVNPQEDQSRYTLTAEFVMRSVPAAA